VNVASVVASSALENLSAYVTSKGGVVAMTRAMALDYGPHNIRVNAVCPGTIATPMSAGLKGAPAHLLEHQSWTALGRIGEPSEIAAAALFLASDEASFITGHSLLVDGGWSAGRMSVHRAAMRGGNMADATLSDQEELQ
jgi:NAD(P)-dependent dehydrogenase (short-subunit alcohol dehydrogenase family)